jgi:hypothetical protein
VFMVLFFVHFSTLVAVFPERLADQVRNLDEICLYMQKILNMRRNNLLAMYECYAAHSKMLLKTAKIFPLRSE